MLYLNSELMSWLHDRGAMPLSYGLRPGIERLWCELSSGHTVSIAPAGVNFYSIQVSFAGRIDNRNASILGLVTTLRLMLP